MAFILQVQTRNQVHKAYHSEISYRTLKRKLQLKKKTKKTAAARPVDFQRVTNRWSAVNLGGVERICSCSRVLVVLTVSTETTSNVRGFPFLFHLPPASGLGRRYLLLWRARCRTLLPLSAWQIRDGTATITPLPSPHSSPPLSLSVLWLERPQAVSLHLPALLSPLGRLWVELQDVRPMSASKDSSAR